jgi:hypothetical protein
MNGQPGPTRAPAATTATLQLSQPGLQLLFVQPNIHGAYPPEIVQQVRRLRQDRRYIFLAFPPKCGGTFIRDVVGRVSGAGPNPFRPGHAMGGRDVTPYLPQLAAQMLSPTGPDVFMTHAHMIGYYSNIQLLNLFRIKPVVMKRNIPDMLCSFADMMETEAEDSSGDYNWSLLCGVHSDASILDLDSDQRADFFVYHQAPWYIQFYASWIRAERERMLPMLWTTFDEFRNDPQSTIAGILEFYGYRGRASQISEAIAQAEANRSALRFNKGESGRGATFLKPHHVQHLHRLAAGYPDIDFAAEGLLPSNLCSMRAREAHDEPALPCVAHG